MKTITKLIASDNINPMKTKAVIYCRVSSREQEETGYSLPAQEKFLREYAQRPENNFEVVKTFQVSESAAGKIRRKIFQEMMEYVTKNKISIVIVETTDRLTRNFTDVITIDAWVMEDENNKIHLTKEGCILHKNSKSHEWFMWRVKVATAEYYVKLLSENVKKGQKEKIEQGWLPTRPPVGYKTVGEKGHKTHVLDEKMAPLVRRAFELYATGNYSMKRLADELYKDGFRTRFGVRPAKSRIEDMLKEPFYYGAIRWNDVLHRNGAHQPIITKELYDKVQEVRTRGGGIKYQRHHFTFRKMFKCKECGGTVSGDMHKGIVYYHCGHYNNCTQKKYTTEEQIEQKLLGVFKFFENITPEEAEKIKDKIKANHAVEIEYKETTIKSLNERYSLLQRRLDSMYDDRLDNKISREFWEKKQKEIIGEQEGLQEQLSKLKSEEAKYFEIWLNILDLARRAKEIYLKRSPEQRRMLLKHIFTDLTLKGPNEVEYLLKKPIEKIASRVQEKLDKEKFELDQKPTKSLNDSDSLPPYTSKLDTYFVGEKNKIRTKKNPSVATQKGSSHSKIITLLRVVDEITTYFRTTSEYHYIPNLKDGIYPLVRPTSEQLATIS